VPPLRDRPEDVPPIADHFLKRFARETGRKIRGFTPAAVEKLKHYRWPGNVRELSHVIERAVLWSHGTTLGVEHLSLVTPGDAPGPADRSPPAAAPPGAQSAPAPMPEPSVLPPPGMDLERWERTMIEQAMRECAGNQTRAAQRLGISRDTLRYRLKKYGIQG